MSEATKNIRLQKLVLTNFKGFTFTLDIGGNDAYVFGENATGKTTLADAFSWLLFDKDSLGRSDFEIKNLDATGQEEHGLEHSVEGVLDINGRIATLKKVYRELWQKRRGSAERTFSGHTTDYFLDGVPIQKKDYVATVAELAGDETSFRLLTSPVAFPALHWQKQRALLLEICGDITDAQVIDSDESLAPLEEILKKRTIDDHRKVVTARRSEINKELEKIPVRIDEQRRMLPDVAGLNKGECQAVVANIETTLNNTKLKLQGIDNGGKISELSKELSITNDAIKQMEWKHYDAYITDANRIRRQIVEINNAVENRARKAKSLASEIAEKRSRIDNLELRLTNLRNEWIRADEEVFHDTTEETCPACGQPLPSDRVEEARERALAVFNNGKAEKLASIEAKGKDLKAEQDRHKAEMEHLKELSIVDESDSNAELENLTAQLEVTTKIAEDYSRIPERAGLVEKKERLEAEIKQARESVSVDREAVEIEITALEDKLSEAKERLDRFASREKGQERINELKKEERRLSSEYENLEKELYLLELFIKTKVGMLTDRINEKFELVRFKLFETQVNQGISECCEITVSGIPYGSGLNNAARIQAGCDIIRTLQKHYGLIVPLFVDNRESVTDLPVMGCQVVSLVVSPEDKALRVEIMKTKRSEAA